MISVSSLCAAAVSPNVWISVPSAALGLAVYVLSVFHGDRPVSTSSVRLASVAAIALLLLGRFYTLIPLPTAYRTYETVWLLIAVGSVGLAAVASERRTLRRLSIGLGLLSVVLATTAITFGEWNSPVGTDVYHAHNEAGEALAEGENPYTDAVLIRNGSPFAEPDAVIEGYPYPPVVLSSYGLASIPGDSRIVSAVAWLAVIGWLAVRALKRPQRDDVGLAIFLLVMSMPIWPVILFVAWTEPLSIALFLGAAVAWRRWPTASAVLLGLTLGSKQYLIFLAPLVLLHSDEHRIRRSVVSFGVVIATILLGLMPDPEAFLTATVLNLADIGFRPDTHSLPGLLATVGIDFNPPVWAWLGLGLGAAVALSLRSRTVSDFLGLGAVALGVAFWIGPAFPNYWFLVLALLAIASVLDVQQTDNNHEKPDDPVSVRLGLSGRLPAA